MQDEHCKEVNLVEESQLLCAAQISKLCAAQHSQHYQNLKHPHLFHTLPESLGEQLVLESGEAYEVPKVCHNLEVRVHVTGIQVIRAFFHQQQAMDDYKVLTSIEVPERLKKVAQLSLFKTITSHNRGGTKHCQQKNTSPEKHVWKLLVKHYFLLVVLNHLALPCLKSPV